tara:strand:- start:205 stop:342 length:138 start_codon:yes stop_codon:yes gene_type:complete
MAYYPDRLTLKDFWRRKLRQGYSRERIQAWINTLIENDFWNPEVE